MKETNRKEGMEEKIIRREINKERNEGWKERNQKMTNEMAIKRAQWMNKTKLNNNHKIFVSFLIRNMEVGDMQSIKFDMC